MLEAAGARSWRGGRQDVPRSRLRRHGWRSHAIACPCRAGAAASQQCAAGGHRHGRPL